jgi:hypothetical protein
VGQYVISPTHLPSQFASTRLHPPGAAASSHQSSAKIVLDDVTPLFVGRPIVSAGNLVFVPKLSATPNHRTSAAARGTIGCLAPITQTWI